MPIDSECCQKDKTTEDYMGDIVRVGDEEEKEIQENIDEEEGWVL